MTQASVLIGEARTYAGTLMDAATQAFGGAVGAADAISFAAVIPGTANMPAAPQFGIELTTPTLPPVSFNPPNPVGPGPTFQDIDRIDAAEGLPAPFVGEPDEVNPPDRPSQLAEFQGQLDALDLAVDFGVAPAVVFGSAPTLRESADIERPITTIDPFAGTAPLMDVDAPDELESRMQVWYRTASHDFTKMVGGYVDAELEKLNPEYHTQLARIEAQLAKYLDGGTGLSADVEDAIYARAQAKNDLEAKRVQDAAFADNAARGFTLPSGAMTSVLARARQDAANNNAKAANEIAIMQAEMEQKNLQFALTTSAGLRTAAVSASMAYMQNLGTLNGQALEYAKGTLNAVVETYNIAAKVYGTQVESLRAQVAAYDGYLKGVFANIERYKADIAAEQAKTQVDLAKVQVYAAIINAEQAKITAYRAHVDAELGKASLQKLRVEVFQAQVQAYGAQVQAKASEWQGYTAAWAGETAKIGGFRAQVDAYTAKMQGYLAGISGKSAAAQAQAMTNEARAKQYAAELSGYSAGVEAAGKVSTTELENNQQVLIAFQAEAVAATARLNSYIEYYRATGQIGVEQAKLDTSTLLANAEYTQRHMGLLAQIHTANAQVYAGVAGAALSGINSLAAESFTE